MTIRVSFKLKWKNSLHKFLITYFCTNFLVLCNYVFMKTLWFKYSVVAFAALFLFIFLSLNTINHGLIYNRLEPKLMNTSSALKFPHCNDYIFKMCSFDVSEPALSCSNKTSFIMIRYNISYCIFIKTFT